MNPADRHFEFGRSLFREANDAFFLFDPRTQIIVDLNPAALRLTGLEKDAACSMRLEDLFAGSGTGGLERLTQALDRTGFFHSREGYFLRRRSRSPLPVNLSVSRIHTEPETVGLVVVRDISDRKRGRGSPQAGRDPIQEPDRVDRRDGLGDRRRRRLLSISPGISRPSPAGRPRDWIGRRLDELLQPDDRDAAIRMHQRAWQGETLPRYELRIRTRAGDCLDCESLLVTRIREGASERVLEVIRDITEQKRIARAARAGRDPATGQGGGRTGQSGQERVPVEREP